MTEQAPDSISKVDFWMKAAAVSFALWSLMIPVGISMLRDSFYDSHASVTKLAEKLNTDIVTTQSRLATLEARQATVLARLELIERKLDDIRERK